MKNFYEKEYLPTMHRIGKTTGYLGALLSFVPALVLALVYGLLPNWAALVTSVLPLFLLLASYGLWNLFLTLRYWVQ